MIQIFKIGDKWHYADGENRGGPYSTRDEAQLKAEHNHTEMLKEEKRSRKEAEKQLKEQEAAKEPDWESEK